MMAIADSVVRGCSFSSDAAGRFWVWVGTRCWPRVGYSSAGREPIVSAGVETAPDAALCPAAVEEGRVGAISPGAGFAVGWDHPFSASDTPA
ncbi:hypothetical protein ACFLWA_03845 [Chloroflexota bacterium]